MTHTCPACGKQWECDCSDEAKRLHFRLLGEHSEAIACSIRCAKQLRALEMFLTRGFS